MPTTTSARPDHGGAAEPAKDARSRPVENVTRVNVAFPFSTIEVMNPDLPDSVKELAGLVADLAAEMHTQHPTEATAELTARTKAFVER